MRGAGCNTLGPDLGLKSLLGDLSGTAPVRPGVAT
jgi:hypothetical protein